MKEGDVSCVEDFIVLVDDALPAALCDALVAEFGDSSEWNATLVASGESNRAIRNADAISISERAVMGRNQRVRHQLDQGLLKACVGVVKKYHQLFPRCRISKDSGFELLRYRPGGFYVEHTDSYQSVPRELACSFLVNDGFTGGEFAFFGGKKVVTLRKGSALLFPANFMYPHQILPVSEGTRFSVVTWFI